MATQALDILVERLFDYSGMFPPESKSFVQALQASAQFPMQLKRHYMVSADIVLAVEVFKTLSEEMLRDAGFSRTCKIAILASSTIAKTEQIAPEIQMIQQVADRFGNDGVSIVSYEIKILPEFLQDPEQLKRLVQTCPFPIALEPDLSVSEWRPVLDAAIGAVATDKERLTLKVRGTGPTAIDNNKIAEVITQVAKAGVHLKATGGLHHPIIEQDTYQNNLGFLNFAVALYLAHFFQDRISASVLRECLESASPNDFSLDDMLGYKEYAISNEELRGLKSRFRFGIGSCSLSEPDQDLARLFV